MITQNSNITLNTAQMPPIVGYTLPSTVSYRVNMPPLDAVQTPATSPVEISDANNTVTTTKKLNTSFIEDAFTTTAIKLKSHHDKKSNNITMQLDVHSTFDELINRRKAWEAGSFAQSNSQLYALLADCLDIYLDVRKSSGLAKSLTALLSERNIGFNASTPLSLKIVRIAFIEPGMEDKVANRAYAYARVIKVAADHGVTGKDLAKFITDHNGIDEIRRKDALGRTRADIQQQHEADAETYLADVAPIATLPMNTHLLPADGEEFSVALVRPNSDNTASIIFALNNAAIVKTVLRHAGKYYSEQSRQQDEMEAHNERRRIETQNRQAAQAINATS